MAISIIIHILDTDPVLGEVDELPSPTDQMITIMGPRRVDGKDLHYLAPGVTTVIFPVNVISFIEVVQSEEDEQIVGFVRE